MNKYNQTTEKLKEIMTTDFVCVNKETNPVAKSLSKLSKKQIAYVIGQYSIFPKHIVSFLERVRDKAEEKEFYEISEELTRNMGEELGTRSKGLTHYEILIKGINEELNLDISEVDASDATFQFIADMRKVFSKKDIFYILGGIYATEMSANPELQIVLNVVNEYSNNVNGKEIPEGMLKTFFDMHIDTWEPGHEEGLNKACQKYLSKEDELENFEKGFKEVLGIMDDWWNGLYQESTNC